MTGVLQPTQPDDARIGPRREWTWALGVGLLTAALCVIPQWRGSFFYYVGDQHEQFAPLWHHFGEELRSGRWATMDPASWMGGNYAAEALIGIWNPVNLVNFVLVSFFDNLSLAAFVVMVEILAVLGVGTFLLAREYGAHRVPAAIVGTALPVSGFTLWYEASGWPAGLMAFTWVVHFWWSARRYSRGRLNPLVPFLFGCLAMTTGNPYASLGLVVLLTAIAVELVLHREFARLAHLVLTGACVGAVALLVFLPLLATSDVTSRQQLAEIANDTFLVPDLGDLVAASSPTYLPSISNWNGARLETVPSTYLAWFVLPLVPWLRWSALRNPKRMASLFVVTAVYLAATLGPSNFWLFRWPVRLIEYFYLAVGVLFAMVLSAGLATDRSRGRMLSSSAILIAGAYLSWAVQPAGYNRIHLAGFALVAALFGAALAAHRWRGVPALGVVAVFGTACVLTLQTSAFPQPTGGGSVYPGYDVSRIEEVTAAYRGTVLQLASLSGVTTEQMQSGEIMFGNLPRAAGLDTIGSYTGMGFREFASTLCMDYRGAVCPEAFDRLWKPTDGVATTPLVDALRVSTLVLQNSLLPDAVQQPPPPGWHVVERTAVRTVWVRDAPLPADGRVSWASNGVQVLVDSSEPHRELVRYHSDTAGRILFARLTWPGYTATVDGVDVRVVDGPSGLLAVDVPPGDHTLMLEFASPGVRLGLVVLGAAGGIVVAQTILLTCLFRRGGRNLSERGSRRPEPVRSRRPGNAVEPGRTSTRATSAGRRPPVTAGRFDSPSA